MSYDTGRWIEAVELMIPQGAALTALSFACRGSWDFYWEDLTALGFEGSQAARTRKIQDLLF
jgi:hypothetical protein